MVYINGQKITDNFKVRTIQKEITLEVSAIEVVRIHGIDSERNMAKQDQYSWKYLWQ